jgi:nicotinamide riboside kinase
VQDNGEQQFEVDVDDSVVIKPFARSVAGQHRDDMVVDQQVNNMNAIVLVNNNVINDEMVCNVFGPIVPPFMQWETC